MEFERGLRPAQWDTLRFFGTAPPRDRTVSGFALFRKTTMGTASMTVSGLVKKGLLTRGEKEVQRNVNLDITALGHQYLHSDPLNDLTLAISELSPERQEILNEALQFLLVSVSADWGSAQNGETNECI
jgi:DNA-binding MarR family transcriptional regulator